MRPIEPFKPREPRSFMKMNWQTIGGLFAALFIGLAVHTIATDGPRFLAIVWALLATTFLFAVLTRRSAG